jgi:hypothetical protein
VPVVRRDDTDQRVTDLGAALCGTALAALRPLGVFGGRARLEAHRALGTLGSPPTYLRSDRPEGQEANAIVSPSSARDSRPGK